MRSGKFSSGFRTRRHLMYAFFITVTAVVASYTGILPVFRSHLMRYLGIGDDGFGLLFSIGSMTGLSSVLFGGRLIDSWGPRRVIRICLAGIGSGMLVMALGGQSFMLFAVAAGITGIFSSPLYIAINIYLAKLFPKHQRRIIALNMASTSLSGIMFPIFAEWLLNLPKKHETISFGDVLHLPFVLTASLIIFASFVYRKRFSTVSQDKHPFRWQWQRHDLPLPPGTLLLGFLIALHSTGDSILYIWMPRFLESGSFRAEIIPPGAVLSLYGLAYMLSRGILAILPDRMGRRSFLVLPGLIGGGTLIAGILSRNYLFTAVGYIFAAFCWSAEYPAMVSMLIRNDKKRFGSAMALSGLFSGLLIFLMMNLVGIIVRNIGSTLMWKVMLLPAGLFILVGLGGLIWLTLFSRRQILPA